MADELVDICDEDNNLTGIQRMKSEAHRLGLWHRTSHVWVYNSAGEILLQQRADGKDFYPGVWDISAAGHVGAGENPIISASRELNEELGISTKKGDLEFFKIRKSMTVFRDIRNNEFNYVYFFRFDGDIGALRLQAEEVQAVRLLSPRELEEELDATPEKYVAPDNGYWLEILGQVSRRAKPRTS